MKTKKVDDGGRRWRCIDEEVDVDEDGDVDEDVECRLTFSLVVDTVQRLLEFRAQRHGSSSSPKLTPQTSSKINHENYRRRHSSTRPLRASIDPNFVSSPDTTIQGRFWAQAQRQHFPEHSVYADEGCDPPGCSSPQRRPLNFEALSAKPRKTEKSPSYYSPPLAMHLKNSLFPKRTS